MRIWAFKVRIFFPHSKQTKCLAVTMSFRGKDGFFASAGSSKIAPYLTEGTNYFHGGYAAIPCRKAIFLNI